MENNIRDFFPKLFGKVLLVYMLWGLPFPAAKGQPALVNESTQINLTGEVSLTFDDASLVNNGDIIFLDFEPKTMAVYGNSDFENHSFSGQTDIPITDFLMNKPGGGVSLKANITVFGEAIFNGGLLVLEEGATFTIAQFLPGAALIESEESRVTGENGSIFTFGPLDAPVAVNPVNIGVEISSMSNLGDTEIIRRHAPGIINGSEGITRTFEINPDNNTDLQATLRFYYFDGELNGNEESSLAVFQQEGMEWVNVPIMDRNTDENWIETGPLDQLSMFIIGVDPCGSIDNTVMLTNKTLRVSEQGGSYQWVDCDNGNAPIDGANERSFVAQATGNYAVIITTQDCEVTSACTFVDVEACNSSSTATAEACDSYTWLGTEYTESGTYTATIPNAAGCDSLLTLNLVIHTVDTEVIESESTLTSQQDNATYQWLDCNNANAPVEGATSQSFTPGTGGSYAVEITTAQGCVQTSACTTVDVVLSIEESSFARLVYLYPNPTSSEVHIDLGETYAQIEVNITSSAGKVIDELELAHTDRITYQLDGQPGIYFIEVTSGDERAIFRLIKQ